MKSSELVRLLKKDGWYEVRQRAAILQHPVKRNIIPVPFHASKEVKKGTLRAILKLAEIETTKR